MMAADLHTNRDLYLFVAELAQRHSATRRGLEQYLTVLWSLGSSHRAVSGVSLEAFATLLDEAFTAALPAVPAQLHASQDEVTEGFRSWERTIGSQVADLREMRKAGTLANEYRSFGVNAPSGARWYNFDPVTFLECAVEGTFGGWQPGDDTGRAHVPGEVAVLDGAGTMTAVDPQDIDEPTYEIEAVGWEQFAEFLWAGQSYE